MERLVSFRSGGQLSFGNFSLPRAGVPCIIMSHGLESSKDGDKWVVLARKFYEAGFPSLRFSYRGCGEGPERSEGEFQDTTVSSRIEDFRAAIRFAESAEVDISRMGVVGSSFGGMVALAARDFRMKAYVVVATPSRPHATMAELFKGYQNGSFFDLPSGRRLKEEVLTDAQRYDICQAAAQVDRPLLIVHGSEDETVPISDAREIYQYASEPKRLEIIDGANHSIDNPDHRELMLHLVVEWFKQHL